MRQFLACQNLRHPSQFTHNYSYRDGIDVLDPMVIGYVIESNRKRKSPFNVELRQKVPKSNGMPNGNFLQT